VALLRSETRKKEKPSKVRINTTVTCEPTKWLEKWKCKGLVTSYTDTIIQALKALKSKVTEQDLKSTQLQNIRNFKDE
jgi:hypothetical protein